MYSKLTKTRVKPNFCVLSDTSSKTQRNRKLLLPVLFATCLLSSQTYALDSGSTGADGALDFTGTPAGTIIDFDPGTFTPALDTDGDSIYHFTTITIPTDVTIRMRADKAGQLPIHWLATGDVVINGTLDLSGEKGGTSTSVRSIPGAGGYPGGAVPGFSLDMGIGPGSRVRVGASAGHVKIGCAINSGGPIYGNAFIMPLIGGSGGSGDLGFLGGGAGGGAILIASNTLISINGAVLAMGGDRNITTGSACGSGGSGGAIRLLAPTVLGAGVLNVSGGFGRASGGRIRIETLQNNFTGTVTTNSPSSIAQTDGELRVVTLAPNPIILPTSGAPTIKVVSIAGNPVAANPRGLFSPVDVTIDTAINADIVLDGANIPLGTTVEVTVWNQTQGTTVVASVPLAGTLANSSATATVLIPAGFSLVYTHVKW